MKKYYLIALALTVLAPAVIAQVADTSEATQVQASTGPVTVISHQPEVLAKASDYHVSIADFDGNGDGMLSRREIPSGHALTFEFHLVDRNHNGYITAAELEAANWK